MRLKKLMCMCLVSVSLSMTLASCGDSNSTTPTTTTAAETTTQATTTAAPTTAAETQTTTADAAGRASGEYTEGKIGDAMHTAFFDYTVLSAKKVSEYEGITPSEGNVLVVCEIAIKNTFGAEIPMFNSDFQMQWDDDAEDAYAYPLEDVDVTDYIPSQFPMAKDESRTVVAIYDVPDSAEYSISYLEYYEDDFEGNVFFVYFTPDAE